jgi:hypothetical protein
LIPNDDLVLAIRETGKGEMAIGIAPRKANIGADTVL